MTPDRAKRSVVGSAIGVAAVYIGLPAALAVGAWLRPRPWRITGVPPRHVTVLIAAHNEAASITAKLDDLAAQAGGWQLQIVVASDGSTDATVELARLHHSNPLVLDLARGGKAAALNAGLAHAVGEVVVFTDANSRLAPDAFEHLLAPFADPAVGGVAGDQRYSTGTTGTARGERDYWSYERVLKRLESTVGNVVSSTGALHAVRRQLIDEVPGDVTDDFYISTGVVARRQRLVFAPEAVAWEQPNDRAGAEYRRRVRIISRGLTAVWRRRQLLNPARHGSYAAVLLIHKVARRLIFVPMLVALFASWPARRAGLVWRLLGLAQVTFYATAAVATFAPRNPLGRNKLAGAAGHFCAANVAAAHAVLNVVRRRRFVVWEPQRV